MRRVLGIRKIVKIKNAMKKITVRGVRLKGRPRTNEMYVWMDGWGKKGDLHSKEDFIRNRSRRHGGKEAVKKGRA